MNALIDDRATPEARIALSMLAVRHGRRALVCRPPVVPVASVPLRHGTKRGADIVVAATLMLALVPQFALVALLTWLTDRGSVLHWQERFARRRRTFRFPKFRSMVTNADRLRAQLDRQNLYGDGATLETKRDPRITWIGRTVRRITIDEPPRTRCVRTGEMSLVRLRPHLPKDMSRSTLGDRRRLDAFPGLPCHWQADGRREIAFPQRVEFGSAYVEHQRPALDVKLLDQTIPAVLTNRGAD